MWYGMFNNKMIASEPSAKWNNLAITITTHFILLLHSFGIINYRLNLLRYLIYIYNINTSFKI